MLISCTSLSLLHVFYNLVKKSGLKACESEYLNMVYQSVVEKLVHFVMTKGWSELLLRIKESRS